MWSKVMIFVAGAAVGWLVGARTGRQAYERVAGRAAEAWRSPGVRRATGTIRRAVRDRVPGVGGAASDALEAAAEGADRFADRHAADGDR
ncbi:hypothetical protein GCM10009840_10800 [Pseudolysinimonas kribbensis]|uniref:YtxH domain-containing protein n=1 Tax=Pseudolysinimonas kribbensis TaxID=433641 RepID=A0ABQ6K4E8_9MICO|nr:hypothetical protein [Pseudolysinimonas kribbensis]GMA95503.1 hypothetical protein GCM10025881_23270 [Pseudolysinimonas kribbensis]